MRVVNGKNVIVLIYDGGVWKPYACGLECTLTVVTEMIETSVIGTGKWKTFEPTYNTWTGNITGLLVLEKENHLTLAELRAKQYAQVELLLKFQHTDDDGEVYTEEGYCFITNSSSVGALNAPASFTVDVQGTRELTQSFTPTPINPPGEVHTYYYPSNGSGEVSFTYAPLIGKTILGAWLQTDYEIITAGTPNALQIKFTSASGLMEWLIPMEPDQTWHIQYQD